MSNKNITLDLKARQDREGRVFYVAKVKAPMLIDCSKGVAFLIFVSDEGQEQMQIGEDDESKNS